MHLPHTLYSGKCIIHSVYVGWDQAEMKETEINDLGKCVGEEVYFSVLHHGIYVINCTR